MLDLCIKNGMVVDGTGNPWYRADVGIQNGRIAAVGDLSGVQAVRTIAADDKIVAPGFIDVHSHSDYLILADPLASSKVLAGVTTDVSGNCGGSAAPQNKMFWQEWWTEDVDERFKLVDRDYAARTLARHNIDFNWHSMGEYLDEVRRMGTSINYANFVGHYTLRIAAYHQERRKPSRAELDSMKSMLAQSMREGAIGFSTEVGSHFIWEYEIEELLELCELTRDLGGVFSYDINNYADRFLEDLEKALWVVEKTNVPTIISHIQVYGRENAGKAKYALQMIEETRRRGMNVVADVMAAANGGGLFFSARAIDMFPQWAIDDLQNVLKSAAGREKLQAALERGEASEFYVSPNRTEEQKASGMVYSFGPLKDPLWHHYVKIVASEDSSLEGKTIYQLMRERNVDDKYRILFDLVEHEPNLRTVLDVVHADNMRDVALHPWVGFGTDGGLVDAIRRPQIPNPCLYATFPMVLRKYVREEKVLRLEDAIRKMTSLPAIAIRQYDRGLLRPGFKADCVVFDFDQVGEVAAYGDEIPAVFSKGIEQVIVNGELVAEDGVHLKNRPGQVLTHQAYFGAPEGGAT